MKEMNISYPISVIVPIYKVEKYIARCVHSLLMQTLNDIEYIFVDDASPDNSIDIVVSILKEYPVRESSVRIIKHEQNLGLPSARNSGLSIATGEYIYHCDSDDWVELNMLEQLYEAAKEKDADVVWCDWFLSFEKNERYMKQPSYSEAKESLTGILSGAMKYNVWNKLIKRSLYVDNGIIFPAGHGMGEDMTMIRLMACAEKVAYVSQAFYHYVKLNGEAFTNTMSERHLADIKYNTNETILFLQSRFGTDWDKELAYYKLNTKFPFLISDDRKMYRLWEKWFPEANQYINSNKNISFRSRMLQQAALRKQFWFVWLYYKLVYKFIYGIVYK